MADAAPTPVRQTRLIVMGSAALCEGFGLVGMETRADATPADVEALLMELTRSQEPALIFLEHRLARVAGAWLQRVRDEGGRIVVTEVPALNAPSDYRPAVDEMVLALLGPSALEDREA